MRSTLGWPADMSVGDCLNHCGKTLIFSAYRPLNPFLSPSTHTEPEEELAPTDPSKCGESVEGRAET